MSRAEIEKLIRQAYAARAAGDVEGVIACFADDAEFKVAGCARSSPVPCGVAGKAEIRSRIQAFIDRFTLHEPEIRAIVVDGEEAAVRSRLVVDAGGEKAETEFFDHFRFAGGKIVYLKQFVDTALANRLAGA